MGPELVGAVAFAEVEAVEVGALDEQIGAQELHHRRHAALVVAQVEDQRVGVGEHGHRRCGGRLRHPRRGEVAQVEIADVALQPLDPLEAEVALPIPQQSAHVLVQRRHRLVGGRRCGRRLRPNAYQQVLVLAELAQYFGHARGERLRRSERNECARVGHGPQLLRALLADGGRDVLLFEQCTDARDDRQLRLAIHRGLLSARSAAPDRA